MKTIIKISFAVLIATTIGLVGACAPAPTPKETPTQTEDMVAELQSRITALEKELSAKEAAIQELQKQVDEKSKRIRELEDTVVKLEKALQEATSPPTPTPSPETVIEDLAYIKIFVSSYSDDPDPQADGVALDISFYDSKSERITFQDIPVTVVIELYGYREVFDTFNHEKMEFVHQQQVTVDHSMRMSEMFGKYIRIPFENIMVDQHKYYEFGTMKVTVTTPKQGNFEDMQDLVRLYPED